jgi:hypothetical protein
MSYEDRELLWDAALGCGFVPIEFKVRENVSIHLYLGDNPSMYWNPLDPKTGHHFDILRARAMDIRLDHFQGSYAISVSLDTVVEGSARMHLDAEDFDKLFCRTLVRAAAEFYRKLQ